jgi:hypothetical protein
MTDATPETEQPPPSPHPLESYRKFPDAFAYGFEVPFGKWRARLDHKAWGKSSNLILYVTETETGAKYWLSVFWGDGFAARDGKINFQHNGEVGEVFEFTIKPTKTGKRALMAPHYRSRPKPRSEPVEVRQAFFKEVGQQSDFQAVLEHDFIGANARARRIDERRVKEVPSEIGRQDAMRLATAILTLFVWRAAPRWRWGKRFLAAGSCRVRVTCGLRRSRSR